MSLTRLHSFMKLAGGDWLCAPASFAVGLNQIFSSYKGELGELALSYKALLFPGRKPLLLHLERVIMAE